MSTVAPYTRASLYGRYLGQAITEQALSWLTIFRTCIAILLSFGIIDFLRFYQLPHYESFIQQPFTLIALLYAAQSRRIYRPLPFTTKSGFLVQGASSCLHSTFLVMVVTLVHLLVIDSMWLLGSAQFYYLTAAFITLCGTISLCFSMAEHKSISWPSIIGSGAAPALCGLMYLEWVNSPLEIFGATLLMLAGAIWAFSTWVPKEGAKPKAWGWRSSRLSRTARPASRQFWLDMLVPTWWPLTLALVPTGLALQYYLPNSIFPSLVVGLMAGLIYLSQLYVPALYTDLLGILPVPVRTRAIATTITGWLTVCVPLVSYLLLCKLAPTSSWVETKAWLMLATAIPNPIFLGIPQIKYRNILVGAAIIGGSAVFMSLIRTPPTDVLITVGVGWVLVKDGPALLALALGDRK